MYKKIVLLVIVVILFFMFFSCLKNTKKEIQGTWELVDISPVDAMDSPPYGFSNRKDYYSSDGKLYIIKADAKLDEKAYQVPYSYANGKRTVKTPDGKEITTEVKFIGNNFMVLIFAKNNKWTFKRMEGAEAYNKAVEPHSIIVLRMKSPKLQMSNFDVKYDAKDYSKLKLKDRVVGVWEVISYKDISQQNVPPYGFLNDKFILTKDGKFYILSPEKQSLEGKMPEQYLVKSKSLIVGIPKGRHISALPPPDGKMEQIVTFNKWGHMVWKNSDAKIFLKLLTKDYKNIPKIPVKIALLERKK